MKNPSPSIQKYCQGRFSKKVREEGFGYLLRSWSHTVSEIEVGYRALFDECLNDMDTRKIISELLPLASDDERAHVEALLPSLDARYLAATHPISSCIWGPRNAAKHGYKPDTDWWYFRIPANLDRVEDRKSWPRY